MKTRMTKNLIKIVLIIILMINFYPISHLLTTRDDSTTMASENISLGIGLTALFWAFSMLFMVCGIILASKKHRTDPV